MGYSLGSSAGVGATDEANNQSRIDWSITLYVSNTAFQYYYEYGYLDVTHLGRVWEISGRHENVYTGSNKTLASGGTWVRHSSTGTLGNIYTSGSYRAGYNSNGTGGSYATGSLTSSSGPAGTSDYNVSPKPPYYTNITRNADPTVFTIAYENTGAYNTGNAPTYTLEYAENYDMNIGYNTMGSGQVSGFNANKTYYFRMYATNPDGTKYSGVYGPYYGKPSAPSIGTPTAPSNSQKRISVPINPPSYVGSGITGYSITRSATGTTTKTFSTGASSPFIDTDADLVPGISYTYTATASSSGYTSNSSTASASVTARGIPSAPTSQPTVSNNGLDVTVASSAISENGGTPINSANANEGYFVQYQLADTLNGTYGYGGTANAWSPATKMNDQISRRHTYQLMAPAKFYKFRVYAANTVIYGSNGANPQLYYPHNNISYTANFATNTAGYFLAAGGKRWDGSQWIPTATAKRYDGENWIPLTIAKRYNGEIWVPLS